MSDSPRSEKELYLAQYSAPVPELDDHRFQINAPNIATTRDSSMDGQNCLPQSRTGEFAGRSDLLQVQNAFREGGPLFRDFEHAVVDDDGSENEVNLVGRRVSVEPTANYHTSRRISVPQQDMGTISRASSVSARSSSPPNSVEAFADPRRRERANTLESHVPPDLEAMLHRTVWGAP